MLRRMSPRAYLAGPDVFLPRPEAFAAKKKALCSRYGFEGVFPLDAVLNLEGLSPHDAAIAISRANEQLIRSCQLVVAHVTPFRGPSADVGTAYEMGFARALGLRVFAYSNEANDFAARCDLLFETKRRPDGSLEDAWQMSVESFGLADNLMLIGAVEDSGGALVQHASSEAARFLDLTGFEQCLRAAAKVFSL